MEQIVTNDQTEVERAMEQTRARLEALSVRLEGNESPEELVSILEAVERFEEAVVAKGGDLMVDESVRGMVVEPDDPHFVLPKRRPGETVERYLDRVAIATHRVRAHHAI